MVSGHAWAIGNRDLRERLLINIFRYLLCLICLSGCSCQRTIKAGYRELLEHIHRNRDSGLVAGLREHLERPYPSMCSRIVSSSWQSMNSIQFSHMVSSIDRGSRPSPRALFNLADHLKLKASQPHARFLHFLSWAEVSQIVQCIKLHLPTPVISWTLCKAFSLRPADE